MPQLIFLAAVVNESNHFEANLEGEHPKGEEDEKQEEACHSNTAQNTLLSRLKHMTSPRKPAGSLHLKILASPLADLPNPYLLHASGDSSQVLIAITHEYTRISAMWDNVIRELSSALQLKAIEKI